MVLRLLEHPHIPRPIKSNFREGLSVLEYFISTHGARKGLADTALRTADSGYLTRRLVDVAQELIVRDEDCGSARGIWVEEINPEGDAYRYLETKLLGRCLLEPVKLSDGTVLEKDTELREDHIERLAQDKEIDRVRVRSVLTCDSIQGVRGKCYGTMLATGKPVDLGEAVGIIAAQSIGEPGTQLTMRTFHTGGVAGDDITHGLPRVVELFEARTPKGATVLAESSGVVRIGENEKGERVVAIVADDGTEEEHVVSRPLARARRSARTCTCRAASASAAYLNRCRHPTIIGDNCFFGARSEVVEGVIVEENSVLSMGVFIGQSTTIFDRETGEVLYGRVPAGSVVVAGTMPAGDRSCALYCAVIVKKVDARTRAKTSLNELLRGD